MARLSEMSYKQARSFEEVLLPIGSIEQHGLHLPLGTDSLIAEMVCDELASRKQMVVCPTLALGFSGEHANFPGTVDLGIDVFLALVERTLDCLGRWFKSIYIVNFHGGNSSALEALLKEMLRPNVTLIHFWRAMHDTMLAMTDQRELGMEHAGEFETSLMLFAKPSLVLEAVDKGPETSISIKGGRAYLKGWRSEELTSVGSFGGAQFASAEKGRAFFEASILKLAEIIDEIQAGSSKGNL